MGRHFFGIALSVVMVGACGSTSGPAPTPPAVTPAVTAPATAQATGPAPSGAAAQLAAFSAHYTAQYAVIAGLLDTLGTDAATNNASAVQKDVADIHAWTQAETAWMTANPPAQCYAALQTYWDTGRLHADKVATVAGAGNWDSVEVNFTISTFKKVAALLDATHC